MLVNIVMSSYVKSTIFEHLISYFKTYGVSDYAITKIPIEKADIYYYFRPHLEQRLRPNSIVTVHHDLEEDDPNLSSERFLPRYREAAVVVCLNSYQQHFLKTYGIVNTVVIPHGYNDKILSPLPKRSKQKKTIGFFSHYYPRNVKGEDYFLSLLRKLNPATVKIILAGRKRKPLCDAIRNMGYECDLYEALPYHKYNNLYSLIDVLIITSRYEGGLASVPEAIATHTPTIAMKVGMIHDVLDNPNIYLLTGDIDVDILTIKNVCFYRKFDHKNNMLFSTWNDVVNRYEQIFLQIFQASVVYQRDSDKKNIHWIDLYRKKLDYFYNTLYLKKRLKEKMLQIKNIYQLKKIKKKEIRDFFQMRLKSS